MTFCLAIKVEDGLVALADTRVVKGDERINKGKLEVLWHHGNPVFIMTSGLRSVRDKAMIYLIEQLEKRLSPHEKLYQIANSFGEQLRLVRQEDGEALAQDGLVFNAHAIIGGKLAADSEPSLFYVYPAGNWIEASKDSPYFIIGRTSYGRPILDSLLRHDIKLAMAVNLGFLAFDATRTSVIDVDFPLDIVTYHAEHGLNQQSYTQQEMHKTSNWWRQCLTEALEKMPMDWQQTLFTKHTPPPRS
ncbi:hypothetical protein [Paraglaciecola sp.]|uniref:hypothetical protein n=1 Tax=Paraglaciecola sp. TaxID=1920173 RepID=UPI0030F3752D